MSRIGFFIQVTPSKALQIWGMLKWKSFSTLNKRHNKNYMTQPQTKKLLSEKARMIRMTLKTNNLKNMPNILKDWIWTNKFKLSGLLEQKLRWFTSIFSREYWKICKHGNCRSVIKIYSCKKAFQSRRAIVRGTICWY